MYQTINPDKQTVESCLKQKTYSIDFYQREYIWSKDTVETLLRDIFYNFELSYAEHKDDELTSKTLEQYNWYYLNVFITNKADGKIYIVDGQQRLTTLTLIATKLYHLTKNDDLKDILKECIYAKDKFKGNIFCLDHTKRKDVMDYILNDKDYNKPYRNKTEENLVERYNDISKFIDSKQMDNKKTDTFIDYFLDRLVLVELEIEQDDTPMVFEVINDRGESLRPFQILKGKMIGSLNKIDTEIYSKKWDESLSYLFGIEDDFFIDLIKSRFIFKRNSKLESAINNSYHRYIFDHNEIADKLAIRKSDKDHITHIKNYIDKDMCYYAKLYSKIRKNGNTFLKYDNVINYLSGQYQNILAACYIYDPDEDIKIDSIAKEFDRLWMLLNLNDIYNSNEFQEISYKLNELLRQSQFCNYRSIFDRIIKNTIKERRTLHSVDTVLDYNSFMRKNYTNMNTRSLRYFLARIEFYLCQETHQNMQNDVEYISTRTGNITGYHIEHILSRNENNRNYFESDEDFDNERNLLGGLLLLKGIDNISSNNEEYGNKLKTYSSGLMWGHTLCSDFYHTNKNFESFNLQLKSKADVNFHPYDKFDKKALVERSRLLYELVKIIWEI
jgi:uncharacterized protein with ParB-like and HNH nuclease domain